MSVERKSLRNGEDRVLSRMEDCRSIVLDNWTDASLFITEHSDSDRAKQMDYDGIDAIRVDNNDTFQFKCRNLDTQEWTEDPTQLEVPVSEVNEDGYESEQARRYRNESVNADYLLLCVYDNDVLVHYKMVDYLQMSRDGLGLSNEYQFNDDGVVRYVTPKDKHILDSWTHFCY